MLTVYSCRRQRTCTEKITFVAEFWDINFNSLYLAPFPALSSLLQSPSVSFVPPRLAAADS